MNRKITLLVLVLILFSCKKEPLQTIASDKKQVATIFQDSILSMKIDNDLENKTRLTEEIAKETLNNYFKRKGFMIQSEVEEDLTIPRMPQNKNKNVIGFESLLLLDNNSGIVSYWNAKPNAIGHCVQPHHAIIGLNRNDFIINNEEFLPSNFTIDSVKIESGRTFVFTNDYSCLQNIILKKYRIELKD